MWTKLATLMKAVTALLIVLVIVQLSETQSVSLASPERERERQTVPTRTHTPTPVPPSPIPSDTPVAPPASDTPTPPGLTQTPEPTATPAAPTKAAVRAELSADTNVYSGPGITYAVLGTLEAGSSVTIVGRNADSSWWQILFTGAPGWIPGTVIATVPASSSVPVVNVPTSGAANSTPTGLPLAGGGIWLLGVGLFFVLNGALMFLAGARARRQRKQTARKAKR